MLVVAVAISMTTACAPLSEAELDEREYRQVDHVERFLAFRVSCTARGKRILISASSSVPRNGIPGVGDRYFCG